MSSCESIARYLLPLYRSFVAKELINTYNCTQVQAAKKLGTTQAAISQYVTSKRGRRNIRNYENIAPSIQEAAVKAAKKLVTEGMAPDEFSNSFCDLCRELQKAKKIP